MCEWRRRAGRAVLAWVAVIAWPAGAHDFSQSESRIDIDGTAVRVRLAVNLLELPGVDVNGDQRVTYDELERAIERVFAALKEHFTLRAPGDAVRVTADKSEIVDDHVLWMDLAYTFGNRVGRLEVTARFDALFGPMHQHLMTARAGGELHRAVLEAGHPTASLDVARVTTGRVLALALAVLGGLGLGVYRARSRLRAVRAKR